MSGTVAFFDWQDCRECQHNDDVAGCMINFPVISKEGNTMECYSFNKKGNGFF
jgi:hypothetical protein